MVDQSKYMYCASLAMKASLKAKKARIGLNAELSSIRIETHTTDAPSRSRSNVDPVMFSLAMIFN